jgi:hypothetical protein
MPVLTIPVGLLLSLQLAVAPPAPPPPAPGTTPDASAPAAGSDLAAEAPVPAWVPEGGSAAHKSTEDITVTNKKMRNAARTTIAGGAIAILGVAAGAAGMVMFYVPRKQLGDLRDKNDGMLPPDDPKRQRAITTMRVAPYVAYTGVGIFVTGVVTALIAGRRFKKLREDKRTSVAFAPSPMYRGAAFNLEVRF